MSEMANARPLLVVHDPEEGHLVYDLLLTNDDDETTVACFPRPVARFPLPSSRWCSFAVDVSGDGSAILCAPYDWTEAVFHDTVMQVGGYGFWERQASPRMRDAEGRLVRWCPRSRHFEAPVEIVDTYRSAPAMLPMGDGTVVRMDTVLFNGIYSFETLRRVALPDGVEKWRATPLPKPPIGRLAEHFYGDEVAYLSAYFAVGTRVWISVARNKGTFSLDTAGDGAGASSWRTEGGWQLPFEGRAVHVPELDAVFGFAAGTGLLCACDVKLQGTPAPVVRRVWPETFPFPWEECFNDDEGRHPETRVSSDLPSLAYLGNGRFCICRPMRTKKKKDQPTVYGAPDTYDASSFLVVEVKRLPGGELRLTERGKTSYMRPPQRRQCPYIGLI